eukprot:1594274-Prymnesium_polylepis.5
MVALHNTASERQLALIEDATTERPLRAAPPAVAARDPDTLQKNVSSLGHAQHSPLAPLACARVEGDAVGRRPVIRDRSQDSAAGRSTYQSRPVSGSAYKSRPSLGFSTYKSRPVSGSQSRMAYTVTLCETTSSESRSYVPRRTRICAQRSEMRDARSPLTLPTEHSI